MSASAKLTKKQKKGLAFRERGSKKNAKAPEVDEDGVPIQEIQDLIEESEEGNDEKPEITKKGKKVEVDRKGKGKANLKEVEKDAADVEDSVAQKTKKRKLSQLDDVEGDAVTNKKKKKTGSTEVGEGTKHEETTKGEKGEKARYILFVGRSSLYSTHSSHAANWWAW